MKKLVLPTIVALTAATNVFAADLPRRATPPIVTPVPVFTWTGLYAGLNAGYGWANDTVQNRALYPNDLVTAGTIADLNIARQRFNEGGFVGGGQLGYNYQFTPGSGLVIGVETDAQFADIKQRRRSAYSYAAPSVYYANYTFTEQFSSDAKDQLDFLGTVRGRIGFAFDRFLVYGTGGFAYGEQKYRSTITDTFGYTSNLGGAGVSSTGQYTSRSNRMQTGSAYGGGVEYAIPTSSFLNVFDSSAVTLKVEYLHYDLGSRNVIGYFNTVPASTTSVAAIASKVKTEGNLVRAGLNFKFGGL